MDDASPNKRPTGQGHQSIWHKQNSALLFPQRCEIPSVNGENIQSNHKSRRKESSSIRLMHDLIGENKLRQMTDHIAWRSFNSRIDDYSKSDMFIMNSDIIIFSTHSGRVHANQHPSYAESERAGWAPTQPDPHSGEKSSETMKPFFFYSIRCSLLNRQISETNWNKRKKLTMIWIKQ